MSEALPIVDNARDYLTLIKPGSVKLAQAYIDIGETLFQRYELDRAILYFQMAAQILERKARKSIKLADAYQAIGFIMFRQGKFDDGRGYIQKAVPLYEQKRLFTPIRLADTRFCLGVDSAMDEDYDQAVVHFRKALNVYRRKAANSLDSAKAYVTIGVLLSMLRVDPIQEAEARRGYEKARKIHEANAPGSFELAQTCSVLAGSCYKAGYTTQARKYYEKAWAILRKQYFNGSKDGSAIYRELASYLHLQGGSRQQEKDCYLTALELDEEDAPDSNNELAINYFFLGWLSFQDGDSNSAEQWYQQSLRAYLGVGDRKKLVMAGTDFIAANANYGMGCVHDDRKEYDHSLKYHQRALDIYERLGPQRVEVALHQDPRTLPNIRAIQKKVSLNPCHLVSIGYDLAPMLWCHALAQLQTDVNATYLVLREQPNVVQARWLC